MRDHRQNPLRRLAWLGILLLLTMTSVASAAAAEATPDQPIPDDPAAKPPVTDGAPYPYPLIPSAPQDRPDAPDQLTIDVWYGLDQTFGEPGLPLPTANILGRVSGPSAVTSLSYTLNGGPSQPLSIGPDQRRLFGPGDFIIELDITLLQPAPATNSVIITATDDQGQTNQTVTVRLETGNTWPLPYLADWSAVPAVTDAADPTTGLWGLDNGLLRNIDVGYDRLLAIGDRGWTDYEVTVPVTVHSLNTCCWSGPSVGGGVGLIVRWPGHTANSPDQQPMLGWRDLGALAWHRWSPQGAAVLELIGQGGQVIASRTDRPVVLGTDYIYKVRVESSPIAGQTATYSFKVWPASEAEPQAWSLVAPGRANEPDAGSVILLAHQATVTFGNVSIVPLDFTGLTLTVDEPENGSITLDPAKAAYQPGEEVTVEAVPDLGYRFTGWLGDLSGNENPITLTLTENITVGATFEPETYHVYISPVASGTVDGLAYRPGDILRADSSNHWSPVLQAVAGPLGKRSDIEAFTFLPDGSLAVAVGRRLSVSGLGVVMPNDVIQLVPDANGGFSGAQAVWLIDGSDVGLTTAGERIDALATTPDGRLVISTTGNAKVNDGGGMSFSLADEDLIVFQAVSFGETTAGSWAMLCDGSAVPGLAGEDVVGATLDPDGATWYLNLQTRFRFGGVTGTNRDIVRLSGCDAAATAQPVWNAQSAGLTRPLDAIMFMP